MPSWKVNFDLVVQVNSPQIVSLIAKCHALSSVIRQIPITPSRRNKIDSLNILRAVRGTTGIEGAELTDEEVRQILAAPRKAVLPPNRRREEQEARNAEKVMEYVARLLRRSPDRPLTEELIRKIHEITTRGINYPNNIPGKYRAFSVSAGDYFPPKGEDEVTKLMKQFISWFNEGAPRDWDSIIKAIVAHFYIVSIHPFGDGNGRTSRAIESFLLYKGGINARGFYSLANYYYQNRQEYVQWLDYVRFKNNGDITPFVLFALKGLASELEEVHKEVLSEVKQIAFRDYVREVLHEKLRTKSGERMLNFVLDIMDRPTDIKDISRGKDHLSSFYRGLSQKTLSRDINYLEKNKLIIQDNGIIKANINVMEQYTPPFEIVGTKSDQ